MSGKPINLRLARKQRARAAKQDKGAENATRHGLTKTQKADEAATKARASRYLDGHKSK